MWKKKQYLSSSGSWSICNCKLSWLIELFSEKIWWCDDVPLGCWRHQPCIRYWWPPGNVSFPLVWGATPQECVMDWPEGSTPGGHSAPPWVPPETFSRFYRGKVPPRGLSYYSWSPLTLHGNSVIWIPHDFAGINHWVLKAASLLLSKGKRTSHKCNYGSTNLKCFSQKFFKISE